MVLFNWLKLNTKVSRGGGMFEQEGVENKVGNDAC